MSDRPMQRHARTVGEQCLRGTHGIRVVMSAAEPVELVGAGEVTAGRGRRTREAGDGPVYLEFPVRPRRQPAGVLLGPRA